MRRVLPIAVAAAVLCASQMPATSTAAPVGAGVAVQAAPAKKAPLVRTKFALSAIAAGTNVSGGMVPVNSAPTSAQSIGCNNKANRDKTNVIAALTLPGLGRLEGVSTRVWTEKRGNLVASNAEHKIARLVLAQNAIGSLEIEGLTSLSRAFNNNGRYGTSSTTRIAKIVLKLADRPAVTLPIPTPGRPLLVPGLVRIAIGEKISRVTKAGAEQRATALDIQVIPLKTRARVAPTRARIDGNIKQGIFRGYAAGVEARGLADNLSIGRQALTLMPCQGTLGKPVIRSIAGVDLSTLGNVEGVSSGLITTNRPAVAKATTAGRVADVSLLDGKVRVKGIVGVATVTRDRGTTTRSSAGSTIAEITINGQVVRIPKIGKLEIPGLVKLEDGLEFKRADGLRVVGLRITVLDGTGAVIDLGIADAGIGQGVKAPPKKKTKK
ncbi:choice-of-anchor P family protein [Nocardioides sp. C4-1]|uniref:choice-of-anchor P family protein n=1 Tax=Nocardioides sp. C4-1 TaxID=3151851 RepID=UPI0032655BD2